MKCPKCHRAMLPGLPGEMACLTCGNRVYEAWPEDVKQEGEVKELAGKDQYKTCEVCNTRMRVSTDRAFCSLCATKLRKWNEGTGIVPPPIIQVDGRWMKNPDYMGRHNKRGAAHYGVAA